MADTWFVYAILCSNKSVYIGQAKDILARWQQHKKGRGAQWTKKYPPTALIYFEEVDSLVAAIRRERELKTTTGRRMLKRIAQECGSQAGEPAEKLLERIKNVGTADVHRLNDNADFKKKAKRIKDKADSRGLSDGVGFNMKAKRKQNGRV
jgi:putative endonuclease